MSRPWRDIEGWLIDEEAALLSAATRSAVMRLNGTSAPLVEIGTYCGNRRW